MVSFVYFPCFLPDLWSLNFPKKGIFYNFVLTSIYIYLSESSHYTLSENAMVYWSLSHRSWDINDYNVKKYADSAEI